MTATSRAVAAVHYCPFCGHALAEDMTAKKQPRQLVMLCPPERLRLTFFGTTHHFSVGVEKLPA